MNDQLKKLISHVLALGIGLGLAAAGAKWLGPDFAKEVCQNAAPAAAAGK